MTTDKKGNSAFGRYGLVVFATFYTFTFVGALFGFGPMEVMLVGSGAFAYLCGDNSVQTVDGCSSQSQTIVNIGFLATCCSVLTPFIGFAIDTFGAPMVSYGMAAMALSGTGLMVEAAATESDWMYYPSFALLGLTTFTGSLMSVQVGLYFKGHTQVRIIMWLNTLFDAGSCTYLFLWMVQENMGVDFTGVAMIYFALAAILYIGGAYFWTIALPEGTGEGDEYLTTGETKPLHVQGDEEESETTGLTESVNQSLRLFMESRMDPSQLDEVVMSRQGSLMKDVHNHHLIPASVYGSQSLPNYQEEGDTTVETYADATLLAEKPANEQLLSTPYILLVFFFSISQISCNWSLITAADFLASIGDDGLYLKIFTLSQPASILALPLVDWIIRKLGFGAAFQGVNMINFVYILIKVTSTNLNIHVATFLMVASVRCFLYATTFSFLPLMLSADVVGRGTGFLCMIGGMLSFSNIPLNSFAARGDFLTPNLIYLFMVIPCTLAAGSVSATIAREKKIKEARAGGVPLPDPILSH
jgi:hypothetical protein